MSKYNLQAHSIGVSYSIKCKTTDCGKVVKYYGCTELEALEHFREAGWRELESGLVLCARCWKEMGLGE